MPKTGMLRVADEYLSALNSRGEPTGKRMPFLEQVDQRLRLRMEGQAHPTYYELSEGTLRILGLLAVAGAREPPSLVGFEEPENGIHPRRIEVIADYLQTRAIIGTTQIIVTTHSPALLDLIPTDYLYTVRRRRRRTLIEPLDTVDGLWRRSNVSEALDNEEEPPAVSEFVLRGAFDA